MFWFFATHYGGARAETTHVPRLHSKSDNMQVLLMLIFWLSARAQPRARLHGARQSIFPRKEILSDYLIAFLAQKAKFLCQSCCRLFLSHAKKILNTYTTKLRMWKKDICLHVRRTFSYKWESIWKVILYGLNFHWTQEFRWQLYLVLRKNKMMSCKAGNMPLCTSNITFHKVAVIAIQFQKVLICCPKGQHTLAKI